MFRIPNSKIFPLQNFPASYLLVTCHAIMHLPNEILLPILRLLDKDDLRTTRLVSKSWCLCSSEYLFDTVYVSTQDEDYHVFDAITQHPMLSNCVRTLEYDAVGFATTYSISDYVERLWMQITGVISRAPEDDCGRFHDADPDVNKLVDLVRKRPKDSRDSGKAYYTEAQKLCEDMHFIQQGYADWIRRAEQEEELKASCLFLTELVQGLRKLTRLESVRLRGGWPCLYGEVASTASLPTIDHDSPLARQWNIFKLFPLQWYWGPNTAGHKWPTGKAEFRILTTALALAGKQPRMFECIYSSDIPPSAFNIDDNPRILSSWLRCLDVYTGLHHLELRLASYGDEPDLREQDKLKGLQSLLSNANNLQHLELTLPVDYQNFPGHPKLFCYDKTFPQSAEWPQLKYFSVGNLALHLKDFIQLFSSLSMKNLEHLEINNMELLSGTWRAGIETLRMAWKLHTFRIMPFSYLYESSPARRRFDIFEDHSLDLVEFYEDIQKYVVNDREHLGMRQPQLLSSEPLETSVECLCKARETCEETGAHAVVLRMLDIHIKYATAMFLRKDDSEQLEFECEEEESALISDFRVWNEGK